MTTHPIDVALIVARIFEALGIRYLVAGSVASTLYGEPRTTLDIDFAIQLEPGRAGERALPERQDGGKSR